MTAAGPALKDAEFTCGMPAAEGEISHVRACTETLGGSKPIGLCRSAYIDMLALMACIGLLLTAGRFDAADADRLQVCAAHGARLGGQ